MGDLITFPLQRAKRGVVWIQAMPSEGKGWEVLFQNDSGEITSLATRRSLVHATETARDKATELHAHLFDENGDAA